MRYDIYYNEEVCGTLSVEREGLMTVFSADCALHAGILRLYVCGRETKALGVMKPEGGRLRLKKRLTANEIKALPEFRRIVLASAPPTTHGEVASPRSESDSPWREYPDGTLRSTDYIALPSQLRHVPPGARREYINGREYLLFKY